jgi:hypothetical protein
MTSLNNLLHNDYIFFPLWVGVLGTIGYAWWSESTRVFTLANNATTSPVSSWPYNWTADRVTDASAISEQLAQQRSFRLQNFVDSEDRILRALNETRESTTSILNKLEEIRQMRVGTSSALNSSLMIPQTPSSVDTVVETAEHISRNTEAMIGAAGFFLDSVGNFM